MNHRMGLSILASVAVLLLGGSTRGQEQQNEMSFFLTSTRPRKGGDLGGLPRAGQPGPLLGGGQGAAVVGHHDRQGLRDDDASKSWNSSHPSRGPDGGCSQNDLKSTGGNGLFYCFATK